MNEDVPPASSLKDPTCPPSEASISGANPAVQAVQLLGRCRLRTKVTKSSATALSAGQRWEQRSLSQAPAPEAFFSNPKLRVSLP